MSPILRVFAEERPRGRTGLRVDGIARALATGLLARTPRPIAALLVGSSGAMLAAYTALFASWHRYF